MASSGWLMVRASHVQRKNVSDVTTNGDGAHVVSEGRLAIELNSGILLVLERDDWETDLHDAPRKLQINLMNGYRIRFFNIHSKHLNYFGAHLHHFRRPITPCWNHSGPKVHMCPVL